MDDLRLHRNGHCRRARRRDIQTSSDKSHLKIVSGGQTGVDRAALDVALKLGMRCGGWCPTGRLAEDGTIPERYPLRELPGGGFAERTRQNVVESDATVIFCRGEPRGGTAETICCCVEANRPHCVIDADVCSVADAAASVAKLLNDNRVSVLNIAGPRASEWPAGGEYVTRVLDSLFSASRYC